MKTMPLAGDDRRAWESAQQLWGVRMHDATLRPGAGREHGAPAWFTFPPQIVVDPRMVADLGGADELESVFAHELGHHALAPGTRLDALKIRHQLARTLVAAGATSLRDDDLAMLANLWTDLLVNARVALLQRRRDGPGEPGITRLSRSLFRASRDTGGRLWWVYLRTYELLWNLPPGTLCAVQPPPAPRLPQPRRADVEASEPYRRRADDRVRAARVEAERVARELAEATITRPGLDADLLAELVRTFAGDAVSGALRFGVLMAPYIVADRAMLERMPSGVCAADEAPPGGPELGRVLADRRLHEPLPAREMPGRGPASGVTRSDGGGAGQALGIAETLELYDAADQDAVLAAWYRSEAARWVRPLTRRAPSTPSEELPGPVETWETGDDLADLDWPATLRAGGVVVPGITTRRRSFLADEPLPRETSITLDLYIDSSGSMPDPQTGSPAVLAGTILALSILRGGGRVRVASFSGPGQVGGSEDFSRDPVRVVRDLALFFGGGTTFPLDLLERRSLGRQPASRERRHLVVLSDDGLVSMFGEGDPDRAGVAAQVRATLSTGTLVVLDSSRQVEPLARAAGYDLLYIESMDDAPRACAELAEVLNG
ncbi:NAD/NADP transhydrogenase subunit alpha [Microbacterium sp. HMWF026]|nr:NAD/NADP transhydrogenase subunit alpha [Microbacterium sp. HMWF026]